MTLFWYVTTAMVNDKNLVNKILKGIKYVKKKKTILIKMQMTAQSLL